MPFRLLMLVVLYIGLTNCRRHTAYFQPADHLSYRTSALSAEVPVRTDLDTINQYAGTELVAEIPDALEATYTRATRQIAEPAHRRTVSRKVAIRKVIVPERIQPSDESPARKPARQSLIAGLVGVASLAIALLAPPLSFLYLLAPIGGIWALVAGIKALNRSHKGDKERGSAIVGIILGSILILLTLLFALVIAAWAGGF